MNRPQRERLFARIGKEAPTLGEDSCWRLGRDVIPLGWMSPDILPVLDILFDRWRKSGRRIDYLTLDFLREVVWRIGDPNPVGWCCPPGGSHNQAAQDGLETALLVEKKLHDESEFLLACFFNARGHDRLWGHDRQMDRLWMETLLCLGVSSPSVVPEILGLIPGVGDQEDRAYLVGVADRMLGARPSVEALLREMATKEDGVVGSICQVLLANRHPSTYSTIVVNDSEARMVLNNIDMHLVLGLPNDLFFALSASVIKNLRWNDTQGFHLIVEGLRRICHDSRKIEFSSTTMTGIAEVSPSIQTPGTFQVPVVASASEIRFLKVLSANTVIWETKTELWSMFGLHQGKQSLDDLILALEKQFDTRMKLMVLMLYRVYRNHRNQQCS